MLMAFAPTVSVLPPSIFPAPGTSRHPEMGRSVHYAKGDPLCIGSFASHIDRTSSHPASHVKMCQRFDVLETGSWVSVFCWVDFETPLETFQAEGIF